MTNKNFQLAFSKYFGTKTRVEWACFSNYEKTLIIEQAKDADEFPILSHENESIQEIIDDHCPFSIEACMFDGKLSLVLVPEYSGPARVMSIEQKRKIEAALLPIILPQTTYLSFQMFQEVK